MNMLMIMTEVVEGPHCARRARALLKSLKAQVGVLWTKYEPWKGSRRVTVQAAFPWPMDIPSSAMPDGCKAGWDYR